MLKNDLLIYNQSYTENTAKVIPPGSALSEGRIVVLVGQPRDGKVLYRPLYDAKGQINEDATGPNATQSSTLPFGNTKAPGTDNQLVRLKDGSLLAEKDGYVWDTIPGAQPAWVGEDVGGPVGQMHKGNRACPIFFHSPDGKNWTLRSFIDSATVLNGKYGVPQNGSPPYWVGGVDRSEVYACPFTGYVYFTSGFYSGDYKGVPAVNNVLLFYSTDGGVKWDCIKSDFPTATPINMTSTPDGRLFLLQGNVIYFSKQSVAEGKPEIRGPYDVSYIENGVAVPQVGGQNVDIYFTHAHPSVSRVSTDTSSSIIRAAYQAVNSSGMQEARVVSIEVTDPNAAPTVTPLTTVRAEDPQNYSVMYFTFIEPDYIDMLPTGAISNASVLYWIEAPRVGAFAGKHYAARYAVFEGLHSSAPGYLSVNDGKPRTWLPAQQEGIGDYMSGGFFWKDRTMNYLAQWVESDAAKSGLRANIVSLPYRRMLFYNADTGAGAVGHIGTDSSLITDWILNAGALAHWTHIAGFGDGGVVFYNKDNGAGAVAHRGGDSSIITDWVLNPGALSKWTHMVSFGDRSLFFYNKDTGAGAVARRGTDNSIITDSTLNPGSLSTWTHIASLRQNRLFFYNQSTGAGAVAHRGANDALVTDWTLKPGALGKWTHVVGFGNDGLFFYNADTGAGAVAHRGTDSSILTDWALKPGALSKWTHVVGFGDGGLFFYDQSTGAGAVAHRAGDSSLVTDWTLKPGALSKWTHVTMI
jgi:hypothetical protein